MTDTPLLRLARIVGAMIDFRDEPNAREWDEIVRDIVTLTNDLDSTPPATPGRVTREQLQQVADVIWDTRASGTPEERARKVIRTLHLTVEDE